METQASLAEESQEYADFVEKFKPKKTTDDCYTPPAVYDVIADWVADEYGLSRSDFVRPFWPGGDYERFEYPAGCVVVDNPPFSILTKIERHYMARGIRFFLFAPALTCVSGNVPGVCAVCASAPIEYENGAVVRTTFVTNLEPDNVIRTAPALHAAVREAVERLKDAKALPKYEYPPEVMTASRASWLNEWGVDYRLPAAHCVHVRALDSQRQAGKAIFGAGFLLSPGEASKVEQAMRSARAAKAAKAARDAEKEDEAIYWELSAREREASALMD